MAPERSPPRTAIPDNCRCSHVELTCQVELAYKIVEIRRRSKPLKLAGFAPDLADRSSLVAQRLPTSIPAPNS
jgi:hypothetical protein